MLESIAQFFKEYGDVAEFVDETAAMIVPFEIAAPPVPLESIEAMDRLVTALRRSGAWGTTLKLRYAFGLHLNIEPPDLDMETVLRIFRAFLMLQDWLEQQIGIDMTRKISPFIDAFPKSYVKRIMDPDYHPDWHAFILDYLEENPTRNRALDLLPLMAHIDADLVKNRLPKEKISPRPAFHYRLPNSKVDQLNWSISDEWRLWQELAADKAASKKLRRDFLIHLNDLFSTKESWVEKSHRCVIDLA